MNKPLPIRIESARGEILNALERIRVQHNLPACIIDGILSSILADVRGEQKIEVINGSNQMIAELSEELEKAKAAAKKVMPEGGQEMPGEEAEGGQEGLETEKTGEITEEEEKAENGANTEG